MLESKVGWASMAAKHRMPIGHFLSLTLLFFLGPHIWKAYGSSQARGQTGATVAGLCQSHSNAGSEPRLRPTPQLTAMPDL